MNQNPSPCDACGGRPAAALWSVAPLDAPAPRFTVVRCESCGTARTEPRPPADALRALYDGDYGEGTSNKLAGPVERMRRWLARRRARALARGLPAGARALDVGCGDSKLVAALGRQGLFAVGLEGSGGPARRAAAATPGRVLLASPGHLPFADATFDLIVVWHVLEHLPEPARTIAEVARCVRPGGRAVVAVPDLGGLAASVGGPAWFGLDVPRHLHHFTARALVALLERHGLDRWRTAHFNLEIAPLCLLETVLRRLGVGRLGLYQHLYARAARRPAAMLASVAVAALLLPPSMVVSVAAAAVRRGSDVQVWTRRRLRRATATAPANQIPDTTKPRRMTQAGG